MPKIQGRIIRILDRRTAIINLGKNAGITNSSVFHILGDPETIVDPFSEEELGEIAVVKSKLKAEQVYDKFTIATTKWTIDILKGSFFRSILSPYSDITETQIVDEGEMVVAPEDLQPWKAKSETPVRVGDIVEVEVKSVPIATESKTDNDQPDSIDDAEKANI